MNTMLDLFQNSWVIGIAGGIISGLIVFFVTNLIFARRQSEEKLQRIRMANSEILYAIRPLIVSELTLSIQLLDSVINSTAKKFGLNIYEVLTHEEIANELTKEVLDNFFLTAENKLKYCDITNNIKGLKSETKAVSTTNYRSGHAPDSEINFLSLMFSVITASTIVIITTSLKKEVFVDNSAAPNLFSLILGVTSIPIFVLGIVNFFRMKKKNKILMDQDDDKSLDSA